MTKDNDTTPVELQDAELTDTNGGFYDEVEIHVATPERPKAPKFGLPDMRGSAVVLGQDGND